MKSVYIFWVLGLTKYFFFRYFFLCSSKYLQTKITWNSSHTSWLVQSLQFASTPPPPATYLLFATGSVWLPVRNLHKARLSMKFNFDKYGSNDIWSLKVLYIVHFRFRWTSKSHSCKYWFLSCKDTRQNNFGSFRTWNRMSRIYIFSFSGILQKVVGR